MSELNIEINSGQTAFEPGDALTGSVSWSLDKPVRTLQLRLFWFTRGKGTEDAAVVETLAFNQPLREESRSFRMRLPPAPYSFSGKLISLIWALELVTEPGKQAARKEFVLAPGVREILLESLPQNQTRKKFFAWNPR